MSSLLRKGALWGAACAASFIFSCRVTAQGPDRTVVAPLLEGELKVDGRLSEPQWDQAAAVRDFVQREPDGGEPATQPTEVRLFYTRRMPFIGARLADSEPTRIVATEYRRDTDLEAEDTFEVFLDTFRDRRNAFYFATNAVGAQRDALVRNEGEALNWEWDGVWEREVV